VRQASLRQFFFSRCFSFINFDMFHNVLVILPAISYLKTVCGREGKAGITTGVPMRPEFLKVTVIKPRVQPSVPYSTQTSTPLLPCLAA
jgi:hypothetical protein